jgi:hypothetical protein
MQTDDRVIYFELTDEQQEALQPLYDALESEGRWSAVIMQASKQNARARLMTKQQAQIVSVTLTGRLCRRLRNTNVKQERRK